ncbi:MAG TPA: pitrilysin family protein [Candidatus Paceibacterota bacterium]|nr:pitrilysin family protein [Candidatus Paceibacterota bacterium]
MRFLRTTLENGTRIITVPMLGNPTVTVMIGVGTGAFHEKPEQSGISHFLEHSCFKGTVRRPTARVITTDLDSIGALYNAFTSKETTGYWAKADVKHFAKIADIAADIFLNSTFPEKEVEKEKGVVIGEIDMYADDPQEKIGEALLRHMYENEPASRDVLGTKATVRAITRQDLVDYRAAQYTGPNTVVTIAGGVSEEEMLSWAKETFSGLSSNVPRPELPTRSREQTAPETVFVDKDTDQAHLILAWRTFERSDPDRYVVGMIKNLLRSGMSSRLFIKLRDEMGSGYYVSASHATHTTFGFFAVSTGTMHERVPEIVQAILDETERLKAEPVPKEELDKVKEFMRAHLLMSLETSDDVAGFCSDQEIHEGRIFYPEEFDAIYSKIAAEDILRVANKVFDRSKLTVAAIGKGIDKDAVRSIITA